MQRIIIISDYILSLYSFIGFKLRVCRIGICWRFYSGKTVRYTYRIKCLYGPLNISSHILNYKQTRVVKQRYDFHVLFDVTQKTCDWNSQSLSRMPSSVGIFVKVWSCSLGYGHGILWRSRNGSTSVIYPFCRFFF